MFLFGSLVHERDRHLKWSELDPVESLLAILSCLCIIGFTASVFLDVVTRELQAPWLWLQEVTSGFFTYGVFIGMALATRRNEHMYLSELTGSMAAPWRLWIEIFSRVVVLGVAGCMAWFGFENFLHDMQSFRMPSLVPLGYYTIAIPLSGMLIALFTLEQLINGVRTGFDHPGVRSDE